MDRIRQPEMSEHALDRAAERFPELKNFDRLTLRKVMVRVCRRGVVYGKSYTAGFHFRKSKLGDKPIVFVVAEDPSALEGLMVVTTLTLEECHNNGGFKANDETLQTPARS